MKFRLHERSFYDIFAPGTIGEMGLHYTKLEEMARSAVIQQKTIAIPHVAAGTNSPSTTNEKRKTYAGRDFLKCEQFQPEHKATKHHVEVGINDSTGYKLPISLSTAAADMPRRSGYPQGSGEVLERDRGFANPLSLSNRPREE